MVKFRDYVEYNYSIKIVGNWYEAVSGFRVKDTDTRRIIEEEYNNLSKLEPVDRLLEIVKIEKVLPIKDGVAIYLKDDSDSLYCYKAFEYKKELNTPDFYSIGVSEAVKWIIDNYNNLKEI